MNTELSNPYAAPRSNFETQRKIAQRASLKPFKAGLIFLGTLFYSSAVALLVSFLPVSVPEGIFALILLGISLTLESIVLGIRYRFKSIWLLLSGTGIFAWVQLCVTVYCLSKLNPTEPSLTPSDIKIFAGIAITTGLLMNLFAIVSGIGAKAFARHEVVAPSPDVTNK